MESLSNSINDIDINDDKNETGSVSGERCCCNGASSVSVLKKFEAATIAMMADKQITISSLSPESPTYDDDAADIEDFIDKYSIFDLSRKDMDSLICEYGMTDAYKVAYDFYTITRKHTPEEFWNMRFDNLYNMMIKVVIYKVVGFNDKQISALFDVGCTY